METLNVDLAERSYPIFIGQGLLDSIDCFAPYIRGKQVMVVTNTTIAPLYLDRLKSVLKEYDVDTVILPDGEQYKTLDTVNQIFTALLEKGHNRTTTLVALGGGVIGDMCGFAAASYQRGVDFIQVPTTLLSQVDSSVGGKTGVNHPMGKNMIGAFYQPRCVVIDTDSLGTLPERELSAGVAEVIKYGLIRDNGFYGWLLEHVESLVRCETEALTEAILTSCRCKADVVAEDERESGVRALLNLGHTFGHAIEAHQGYGKWLHGEAVATGMLMAADLSCRLGWLNQDAVTQLRGLLVRANLPVVAPAEMSEVDFISRMKLDKKVMDGQIRLVLLTSIGTAVISSSAPEHVLRETLVAGERLGCCVDVL